MATTYKVLGQVNPSATTVTSVYTVPSATSAVVSTIVICNQAATDGSFRIAVRPAGETLANKHFLAFDTTVPANDSIALTMGVTLAATDVVSVYASSASQSFSVFGSELA